jgi:hypothetical protein
MIHNRYLPMWLHRLYSGIFGAALFAGFASIWFAEPPDTWRHVVSRCLLCASAPVGTTLALAEHRFSIVEGVAGGHGYDELTNKMNTKSRTDPASGVGGQ